MDINTLTRAYTQAEQLKKQKTIKKQEFSLKDEASLLIRLLLILPENRTAEICKEIKKILSVASFSFETFFEFWKRRDGGIFEEN